MEILIQQETTGIRRRVGEKGANSVGPRPRRKLPGPRVHRRDAPTIAYREGTLAVCTNDKKFYYVRAS